MPTKWNKLLTGLIPGLVVPLITFLVLFLILKGNYTFSDFFNRAVDRHILTKFLSLSVLPNLLLFFLFIRKDFLLSARGVLAATLLEAFLILVLQIL